MLCFCALTVEELDARILSVITATLDQFGANISRIVFYKFKTETGLDRGQVLPKNLDQLATCLSTMFGSGYKLVEIRIARELIREFGITQERNSSSTFVEKTPKCD